VHGAAPVAGIVLPSKGMPKGPEDLLLRFGLFARLHTSVVEVEPGGLNVELVCWLSRGDGSRPQEETANKRHFQQM